MEREREIVITWEKFYKLDQVEWQPIGDRASLAGEDLGSLWSAMVNTLDSLRLCKSFWFSDFWNEMEKNKCEGSKREGCGEE